MKVQSLALNIGNYGCLAFCYANVVESLNDGWNPDKMACQMKLLADVIDAMNAGKLGEDCFVKSAADYMSYLDNARHTFKVTKEELDGTVNSLAGKIAAVRFDNNGHSHWCLYAGDRIVFDSLDSSQCRKFGKPMSARVITIEENK